MVDPMTGMTLAAGMIAKVAFDEFVKAGAGEVAKRSVSGTAELVKDLRSRIQAKFQGDVRAEKALQAVEQEGSQPALNKLETYLDDAMAEDEVFASEVQQVAQQIINIQNKTIKSDRTYNNYGRDQINIERIDGNPKIGGS